MPVARILWVDDEIELLEAHRLFLELKGYAITTCTNGFDALIKVNENSFDLLLLDESMPGLTGLEIVSRVRKVKPHLPIVLVTKNETESLMEEAIGSQITDYLIKPVNPNQVLLALKKILENRKLVSRKTTSDYMRQFRTMFDEIEQKAGHHDWIELYNQLVFWDLEMEKSEETEMAEVHRQQMKEANALFFKFINRNYPSWINGTDPFPPVLSHTLFRDKISPYIQKGKPLIWIVLDNFRLDQWKTIAPLLNDYFHFDSDDCYYSMLPTATHYCRNAIFAGELPAAIEKKYPDRWKKEVDEDGKNNEEQFFLGQQLNAANLSSISWQYQKVSSHAEALKLADQSLNLLSYDLSVIVYNFVDMLSHARSELDLLKELAADAVAYRSVTRSWFLHAPLFQALKKIAEKECTVLLTTDHGSIQVKNPVRVTTDRNASNNLRYKNGRHMDFDPRDFFVVRQPDQAGLPKESIHATFIFAGNEDYICYPNQFNHFAALYRNTFQHGGISLEEMIVPVVRLTSRKIK
jgi:DNA-binding response OmpR family regulator